MNKMFHNKTSSYQSCAKFASFRYATRGACFLGG